MEFWLISLFLLIFVAILVIVVVWAFSSKTTSTSTTSNTQKITSYIQTTLPIYPQDDLWWGKIPFGSEGTDSEFTMIIDTGSSTISLPSNICASCDGPPFIQDDGQTATGSVGYGGGQNMEYYTTSLDSPVLGNNISVSVVTNGANPGGKVYNVLGLLNKSLALQNLIIDFPGRTIEFNNLDTSLLSGLVPSPITDNTYISVNVTGSTQISSVILDSGTNYVLTDADFPNGFSFTLGNVDIYVPANIIRKNMNRGNTGKIVLGNYVMSKYKWYFDFQNRLVWCSL